MGKKQTFASDTSQRSITDWIRALLVLLLGLIIAHLGVTLFLLSALGTDTFTVFIQGLSRVAGLSVGTVHVIVLCILMVLMLLTTKGYVKPGTIVCAFCGGPIFFRNAGSYHQRSGRMCDSLFGNVCCNQQQCRHRTE